TTSSSLFTVPDTPQIYTLPLHDALPISQHERAQPRRAPRGDAADPGARQGRVREDARRRRPAGGGGRRGGGAGLLPAGRRRRARSEEHTSELQSRGHLVCRLLLEKKKKE